MYSLPWGTSSLLSRAWPSSPTVWHGLYCSHPHRSWSVWRVHPELLFIPWNPHLVYVEFLIGEESEIAWTLQFLQHVQSDHIVPPSLVRHKLPSPPHILFILLIYPMSSSELYYLEMLNNSSWLAEVRFDNVLNLLLSNVAVVNIC